ncbi:hypothetical protein HPB51_014476 [Rhipicephalus microplus]|uniref:Uncharacterized protein n=1 Tax=Rhipicephalus microplus TaxID=6941 RepID=A0A9J6EAY4_RHIMP|nr:hypothetical protein HPB51_014476 [Rhipicephalus microplus]
MMVLIGNRQGCSFTRRGASVSTEFFTSRGASSSAQTVRLGERRELAPDAVRGRVHVESLRLLHVSRHSKHDGAAALFTCSLRAMPDWVCHPRWRERLSSGRRALLRGRMPAVAASSQEKAEPEAVLLHYDRECTFHAVQCRNCEQRLLRTDIAAHYASGCCQNASCARNAQSNREISSPASFETNVVLDKFSTLERKINEVLEVCSASNSARSQDISHAVGAFENTLQRIMEGIEENISTMITRQLTAGLQELKAATTVLCSDHLASSQSQMNEFVEQLRQRDGSQIQEIGSVLRDSQVEVKEEVKIQLEKTVSLLIASKCDVKQNVRTQLEEFVQEMRNCVGVLKEHVSKVEDTLSSRLTDQQHSLRAVLDSLNKNKESIEREKSVTAATMTKGETLWHFKHEFLLSQALERLELLRQQIYRQNEEPWVSKSEYDFHDWFTMGTKDFESSSFYVTLENYKKIFNSDRVLYITVNRYYRDVCIYITFSRGFMGDKFLDVRVDCLRTLGNSGFPFDEILQMS